MSVLSIVWLAACVGSLDESTSTQGSYLTDAGSGSGSGSDGGTTVDAGSGSGSDVGSDGGTPDAGSGSGSAGGCTGAPELPKPGICGDQGTAVWSGDEYYQMVDVSYHCENAASVWIDCGEQVVAITDDMRTIPARYEEGGSLHLEWSCDYDTHAWVLTYGSGSALELVHWSAPEGQSPSGYYNETQRSRYFTVENGGLAAHEMEITAGVSYDVRWEHDVIGETTINVQTCRMSSDDWRGVLGANFELDAHIDYTTVNSLVKIRGDATSSQWRREDASGDWVESSGYTKAKTVNVWAMNNGAQGPMTRLESTTESQTDDHNWTRTHDGSYVRDWTYETVPIPGGTSVKYNLLADELTSHRNTQSNGTWTEKWKRDVSTSWKHDPSGSGALIFDTNTVSYSDASEGQSTHYDRTTVYTDQANVPQSVVITSSAGSVTAVWWHLPTGGWVLPTCPSYLSTAPFLISAEQEAFPDMNTTVHVPLGCAY